MDNNKTIINGIDVSECGYYNKDNEPYCCEIWDNECEAHIEDAMPYCKNVEYPPFTAEKQLELLKICFDKYERLEKVRGLKERCIIYHHFESNGYTEFVNCETWEETIAGLINNLWQDLTEEERKQIKEILE